MSDEQGYNGWTNYETWNVALWLSNDEGLYLTTREMTADESLDSVYELADQLSDFVEEIAEQMCPGVIEGASFVTDLFRGALSDVNWHEIAENLISELVEA